MARGRNPNLIAQQLLQGQVADVASTTGFVPQPQLRPQTQGQALLAPEPVQRPQQQITTAAELLNPNVGRSIIGQNLLEFSNDRSRSPIARGLAAFIGSKTLREEGERTGEQERRRETAAAEAQAEQRRVAQGFKEREVTEKEKTGAAQRAKFDADIAKLEKEGTTGGLSQEDIFKRGTKLRGEFTNLSKEFIKQRDAFGRVQASVEDPSAAGDLALIFNFMKVLDPGSTVREGEFATAANSAGIPDRLRAQYNKVSTGERLADKQRNDFADRADKLFAKADTQHNKRVEQFTGLSTRLGVDPQNVLLDLGLAEQQATEEQAAEAPQQTPIPQDLTALSDEELLGLAR